jgi:hypothetical protein
MFRVDSLLPQARCEPGFFCVAGVRTACPAGTFSAVSGLSSTCTSLCTAGYYCPTGSTSGQAMQCGGVNFYW